MLLQRVERDHGREERSCDPLAPTAWELRRATYNHVAKDVDVLRPSLQKLMNGLKVVWKVDFSKIIDPEKLVAFQGTKGPSTSAVSEIVLAVDEPLKL